MDGDGSVLSEFGEAKTLDPTGGTLRDLLERGKEQCDHPRLETAEVLLFLGPKGLREDAVVRTREQNHVESATL